MTVGPTATAIISAMAVTALAGLVPAEFAADRSAKSWVPRKWAWYRLKLAGLQVVATLIVAVGAQRIGWAPTRTADVWNAIAHGVSWSVAAVAVLRAEVTGFRIEDATPGFSVLRTFSGWFGATLADSVEDAVRAEYRSSDLPALKSAAYEAVAGMSPPQQDGSPTPDQVSLGTQIEGYQAGGPDPSLCRELIVTLVAKHHMKRLS